MSKKGIISSEEWESGFSTRNSPEKVSKVLSFLESLGKGSGAKMTAIQRETGIKWPRTVVVKLVTDGKLESTKIGKAKYYRVK